MFQTISETCSDNTLIDKHLDYFIYVCYHQNLTLHKDGVNSSPLFDDEKPNDHIDIKGKSPNDHIGIRRENKLLVPDSQAVEEKKF